MAGLIPLPFTAYDCTREPSEPFVFVSYAHLDAEEVYQDIGHLDGLGFRIWYDEGIPPGQGISHQISAAIRGCAYFIVFVSEASIHSQYVSKEIHLADRCQKQILPVQLCELELPDWLDLVLGNTLAILKHRWPREEYLRRLQRALPPGTMARTEPTGPEQHYQTEVARRLQKSGYSEALAKELLDLAPLCGLDEQTASKIIDESRRQLASQGVGGLEVLAKLIQYYVSQGEIVPEQRATLAARAQALDVPQVQWEAMVQEAAAATARDLLVQGDRLGAKRLLVSCVGEVLPQSDNVRRLLEQLVHRPADVPAAGPAASVTTARDERPTETTSQPAWDRATTALGPERAVVWVRVPAGMFLRGCPEEFIRRIESKFGAPADVLRKFPVRKEPADQFWISRTAITNAQYYAFVKATGHRYPVGWRGVSPPYPVANADKPVTGVTFADSADFAAWLGARLPTRAEYEKAARGENGLLYPWGDQFDPDRCNTAESERGELTLADAFPQGASPYGVLDLVGNVWEWADGTRGELTMTVGSSYEATGEVYGATFFDVSRPAESSEKDLGFRVASSDIRGLLLATVEGSGD